MSLNSLCRSGQPQIHRAPPVSASRVLDPKDVHHHVPLNYALLLCPEYYLMVSNKNIPSKNVIGY